MAHKFEIATAAGTFEYFHKGHKQFLLAAFDAADTIYIAITTDDFAKSSRQLSDVIPFVIRKKAVEQFLFHEGLEKRAKIIQLHDIYGPTLDSDCPFEAIIVTKKTRYGAELINKLRQKKRLPKLDIVETAFVQAADGGEISSSRIRAGEIDREGKLYVKKEWLTKTLTLPEHIRPLLQRPIEDLVAGNEDNLNKAVDIIKKRMQSYDKKLIVTVGDIVAQSFNQGKLSMDIAIVDFQVKREERFKNVREAGFKKDQPDAVVENPKGTLAGELFQAVKEAFLRYNNVKPYIVRVVGEEDLATLAVILAAPLGTHVFYGQPNEGIVQVVVTEEKKAEVYNIVSQFNY